MDEAWMGVVGWEGLYEVSTLGRVRSLARTITRSSSPQRVPERIMATPVGTHGYPRVNLCRNGKYTQYTVHSLLLTAFVGACPPGMEALHGDGDKTNCTLANLRWGTSAENKADILKHGTNFWANRPTCPKGHPYDETNTYVWGGRRHCKECRAEYKRLRKRRIAEAVSR